MVKDFMFISKNKSPVKIDLNPQKVKFETVPGKIFPRYIDEIKMSDDLDFEWTNAAISMKSDEVFKASIKFTGEIQNFVIDCSNEKEIVDAVMNTLRIIDGRKSYQSYETKHTYKYNGIIIGRIGFSGKHFIFDFAFLPQKFETALNKKLNLINLTVRTLSFNRLRLTGNIDIELGDNRISTFEFRNEHDLRRILLLSKNYSHSISLIDFSDWCMTPSETNCIKLTKLASTEEPRTQKIIDQIKTINDKITEFRFYARIDQIDHLIKFLPKCKKFYCLISNQDVRHDATIKSEDFDEKQNSIATFIQNKYDDIKITFRANKIYDTFKPPTYVPMEVDPFEDVSLDEMNGTMLPELDDD